MKYLPLLIGNLFRRKLRTALTVLSVASAMFLFGLLAVIDTAFSVGPDAASVDRLVIIGRSGVIQPLPAKYQREVAKMDGVADIANATWFGGVYQEEKNFFPQFAVEDEAYLRLYPEYVVSDAEMKAYLDDRQGAIVGKATAERFGWKLGDRVPLKGTIYAGTWEFTIRGIYRGSKPKVDETGFMFRSVYLQERGPDWAKGQIGWYVVRIHDPTRAEEISKAIDARFANSSSETKTQPEEVFMTSWINMMGNIRLLILVIGSVVLFTLLLVTGNTMALAVRERTGELAVLKTIGFGNGTVVGLVLTESVLIAGIGGVLGLGLVKLMTLGGSPMPGMLPIFILSNERLAEGAVLIVLLGLAAGTIPAVMAMRLKIVDALRRV